MQTWTCSSSQQASGLAEPPGGPSRLAPLPSRPPSPASQFPPQQQQKQFPATTIFPPPSHHTSSGVPCPSNPALILILILLLLFFPLSLFCIGDFQPPPIFHCLLLFARLPVCLSCSAAQTDFRSAQYQIRIASGAGSNVTIRAAHTIWATRTAKVASLAHSRQPAVFSPQAQHRLQFTTSFRW